MVPLTGLWVIAATGNIYAGLYHPMAIAAMTFIVGSIALPDTHGQRIWDEVATTPEAARQRAETVATVSYSRGAETLPASFG